MTNHETINHEIACLDYKIIIGDGLEVGTRLAELGLGKRAFVISDDNVAPLHLQKVADSLRAADFTVGRAVIPHGERSKCLGQFGRLCEAVLAWGIGREDTVIGLGGGVVGDLSGFVASSLLRGVNLIHLPTSLLAQVDSAIGGKGGINGTVGKNLIGSFYQPRLVLADRDRLATLPSEELLGGYAEVVKYALIGDEEMFAILEAEPLGDEGMIAPSAAIIARSAKFKAEIVTADEKEHGLRALLNLGHTFGHGIEAQSGFKTPHGPAVAVGLVAAFKISAKLGLCPSADAERVECHLRAVGFTTDFAKMAGGKGLLPFMRKDKKNRKSGHITLVLVRGIGKAFVAEPIAEQRLAELLADV